MDLSEPLLLHYYKLAFGLAMSARKAKVTVA